MAKINIVCVNPLLLGSQCYVSQALEEATLHRNQDQMSEDEKTSIEDLLQDYGAHVYHTTGVPFNKDDCQDLTKGGISNLYDLLNTRACDLASITGIERPGKFSGEYNMSKIFDMLECRLGYKLHPQFLHKEQPTVQSSRKRIDLDKLSTSTLLIRNIVDKVSVA